MPKSSICTFHEYVNVVFNLVSESCPVLDEQEQRVINERLTYSDHINAPQKVCIRYFVPDERKSGGAIVEVSGIGKKHLPLTEQSLWQMGVLFPSET